MTIAGGVYTLIYLTSPAGVYSAQVGSTSPPVPAYGSMSLDISMAIPYPGATAGEYCLHGTLTETLVANGKPDLMMTIDF